MNHVSNFGPGLDVTEARTDTGLDVAEARTGLVKGARYFVDNDLTVQIA